MAKQNNYNSIIVTHYDIGIANNESVPRESLWKPYDATYHKNLLYNMLFFYFDIFQNKKRLSPLSLLKWQNAPRQKNNLIVIMQSDYFSLNGLSYFVSIFSNNFSIVSALSNNVLSILFCFFR